MGDPDDYYIELAIAEASKSVAEDDAEPHPFVGAVVVKDGKELKSAYRGETGPGDHAEYGVLRKKLQNVGLSGATIFTTLEPCTRRDHPKEACALRIIKRNLSRVVIGIPDANFYICGTGYKCLLDAGIEVQFFQREHAKLVEELNAEFIKYHKNDRTPYFVEMERYRKNRLEGHICDALTVFYRYSLKHRVPLFEELLAKSAIRLVVDLILSDTAADRSNVEGVIDSLSADLVQKELLIPNEYQEVVKRLPPGSFSRRF